MKKRIIVLSIILMLLISILIVVILLNKNFNNPIDQNLIIQEERYANGINNPGTLIDGQIPQKVKIENIFFTVEGCIKTYIEYSLKNDKKAIGDLLDYKFKENNNINEGNIEEYFITYADSNKTKEVYSISRT